MECTKQEKSLNDTNTLKTNEDNIKLYAKQPMYIEMKGDFNVIDKVKNAIGDDILFLFDIDENLYHPDNKLASEEKEFLYLLYKEFGGLLTKDELSKKIKKEKLQMWSQIFYDINADMKLVWDKSYKFPWHKYLCPEESLRNILLSIKNVRMGIFTNGTAKRAKELLNLMGLEDLFEFVVCTTEYDNKYICKPNMESYMYFNKVLDIKNVKNVYFFDDAKSNIDTAVEIGWRAYHTTVDEHIYHQLYRALKDASYENNDLYNLLSTAIQNSNNKRKMLKPDR